MPDADTAEDREAPAPAVDRHGDAAGTKHGSAQSRPVQRQAGRGTLMMAGIVSAVLLLGFITVYTLKSRDASELAAATAAEVAAPPSVDIAIAKPAPKTGVLTLPGETAPWYGATIYARVDGYVGKWQADIGDHVAAGQVLATIETPDLDAQLAAARAKRDAAAANVKVSEAEAHFAESTYQRWKGSPKGVVSEQETEDKQAAFESAAAKLTASRAQVELAQGDVDRLRAFEQFKQVTAPFAGTITQRKIDIGNLVTAGSTASTTPLYQMVQDDPIRVFVDVPQDAAGSMKIGTPVDVATSGKQHRTYAGTIARTSASVDPLARTLKVEIDLPNHDESLVPGLYIDAAFHLEAGGVAEVPAAALMFRSSGPQVAVIDGDRVKFHDVTIAEDNGTSVALADGVHEGDRVVLNISSQIADGEAVRVVDASAPPAGVTAAAR
jgi:RND family efflux transporter MFP subunit